MVAAITTALTLSALGFLPLFGGPGYEAALAAGLVVPSLAALATAYELCRERPRTVSLGGRGALGFGIAVGAALAAIATLIALLHGARVGYCDLGHGLWLELLGPGFGAVMGGAWGAAAGGWGLLGNSERQRRLLATLFALAGPLAGVLLSLWRFYVSPAVFAFDPFFGYFAGPLYDTVIDPLERLASYRLGSLMTLLAAWVFAGWISERSGRLRFDLSGNPGQLLAGSAALALSFTLAAFGPQLSHNTTRASILEALSRSFSYGRCDIRYDPSVPRAHVKLLARECHAHLESLEAYFETRGPQRVRVLLFANSQQKGTLMGAANTYIAKPWLEEIYLQPDQYPHSVLRHELAHVVAGSFARGPFKVAGPLGGWLPDPGRIEGYAEAAAPREHSDFSAREWAAAMADAGLLPPLRSLFELGFLGENSSTAYTAAGAFVGWLKERVGAQGLKAWYGGVPLAKVTSGKDLAELDREFRADLAKLPLSERLRVAAKARFSVPSIFGRRCPHAVDQRYLEAQGLLGALDIEGAEGAFQDVLELDPDHIGARLGLGTCALRRSEPARALAAYAGVARDERLALGQRLGAREAMADTEFLAGHPERARSIYEELSRQVASEDHLRNLEVKELATKATGLERQALAALLLGTFKRPPTWDSAAPLLGAWRDHEPEQGLAPYLIGRNLFNRSLFDDTARYLDEALTRRLNLVSVEREALRLRVIVACARGEPRTARDSLERFLSLVGTTSARKRSVLAFAQRCQIVPRGVSPQSAAKQ